VWLLHAHAYFDHGVRERIAEARAFMDLVIRTFAGTDHLEVRGFTPFPAGAHRRGSRKDVESEFVLGSPSKSGSKRC